MAITSEVLITVNVTAHEEGILLHKTLRSIWAMVESARTSGIEDIQFNVSLDQADHETIRVANDFKKEHTQVNIFLLDFGDLSESRNFLISKSAGKYIVFFDGDDFFTENYLYKSYHLAESIKEPAVYSAEFILKFDNQNSLLRKLDSSSVNFNSRYLFEHNYFISQVFAHRKVYEALKYEPIKIDSGYGMESWHWSCNVIINGFKFYNVPNTIHFYRQKKHRSLSVEQASSKAVIRPTKLFHPKNYINFTSQGRPQINQMSQETIRPLKARVKTKTIWLARKFTGGGTSSTYMYLRNQYFLNKTYASQLKRKFGKAKSSVQLLNDVTYSTSELSKRFRDYGISEEAFTCWAKINQYEPMIRPSLDHLSEISILDYPTESRLSEKYLGFCHEYLDCGFTDVILLPHLIRGGADLAAINLIKVLSEDLQKKVLVFTTLPVESPWAQEVSQAQNVTFLELRDYLAGIDDEQQKLFMVRILQNWDIQRLTVINSTFGYQLIEDYGKAIGKSCTIILHAYAYDMTEEGYIFNVIKNGLVDIYPNVDQYITDCAAFKKQLIEVNGFKSDKISPLYLPIKSNVKPKQSGTLTRKVLWASRISTAKIVEVAVAIGALLEDKNIELHFYGGLDIEYSRDGYFKSLIRNYKNIFYHGAYDGFASIDHKKFDIFLLTSKNEGMPNVVLESAMANLFVISAAVGGVPEVIEDGENGYLVNDNFNPEEYAKKIISFYDSPALHDEEKRKRINQTVINRHSWKAYRTETQKLYP